MGSTIKLERMPNHVLPLGVDADAPVKVGP